MSYPVPFTSIDSRDVKLYRAFRRFGPSGGGKQWLGPWGTLESAREDQEKFRRGTDHLT